MQSHNRVEKKYRPDIDGLRAIAVIAVLAYHANIQGFNGGYVGVDVFFVISGYLITQLLNAELVESGKIDLLGFYTRRIKRLLPALAVVLVSTVALTVLLVPGFLDARKFAASIRWAAFGFANIFFKRNTGGYFDGATEEMPLLHLWSLGVEEQFYMVWPLLLWLCHRMFIEKDQTRSSGIKKVVATLAILSIGSFSLAHGSISAGNSSSAFYLMPLRAWELGVGAILAFLPGRKRAETNQATGNLLAALGISLILYSIFFYSATTPFPGLAALPPTLGAALLIFAGERFPRNFIASSLSTRPLVHIGILSYGWYLWHWPLLVLARLWNLGATPDLPTKLTALALSLVLAELSLRWVETPIRRDQFRLAKNALVAAMGLSLCGSLALGSLTVEKLQALSLSMRLGSDLVKQMRAETPFAGRCFSLNEIGSDRCRISFAKGHPPSALLAIWGDSHSCSYFPLIENYGKTREIELTQYCQGQTPPLIGGANAERVFQDLRKKVTELAPAPVSVVLASRWVSYTGKRFSPLETGSFPNFGSEPESLDALKNRLRETYLALHALGVFRVLVILPSPEFELPTYRCLLRSKAPCETQRAAWEQYRNKVVQVIRESAAPFNYVRLIDPASAMCVDEVCPQVFRGVPVVTDTNHPTVFTAHQVGSKHLTELEWSIGASKSN